MDVPEHIKLILKDRLVLLAIDFCRYPDHTLVVRCVRPDLVLVEPYIETYWVEKKDISTITEVSWLVKKPVVTKTKDELKFDFRVEILGTSFSGVILCCQNKKKYNKLKYLDAVDPNVQHHLRYVYCDESEQCVRLVCADKQGYYQQTRTL